MKVVFDKNELLSVLIPAAAVVPGHNTSPMMDGILFECPGDEAGTCRITSYDMEKGVRATVPAEILGEGKFVLNKQKISQIIRLLPEGRVIFDVDPGLRVRVSCELSNFDVMGFDGSDFPGLPLLSGDRCFKIPGRRLRSVLAKTVIYTAPNDFRPACTGVMLEIVNGVMTAVGWDGSRMAVCEEKLDDGAPDANVIVPVKFLSELLKIIRDSDDGVTVSIARKHIIFLVDGVYYFTRLISTEYPDYRNAVPSGNLTEVFIKTHELRAALERAAVITEDKLGGSSRGVRFDIEDDYVRISATSSSGGIDERIPVSKKGNDCFVVLSCRYLLETLRACPEIFALRISLTDSTSVVCVEESNGSGLIRDDCGTVPEGYDRPDSDGDERMRFVYFLMPRRR